MTDACPDDDVNGQVSRAVPLSFLLTVGTEIVFIARRVVLWSNVPSGPPLATILIVICPPRADGMSQL